tara:strand:- start:15 stop:251 length:237 start_codon:yes stop_codon:yes gene_type:complete
MPRKKSVESTKEIAKAPTQGDIARLITDAFDMLSNDVIVRLMQDTDLETEELQVVKTSLTGAAQSMKNRTIDQLLKYY